MRRLAILLALIATPALPQAVPDPRPVPLVDTDLPGGDIRSIFDTTLQACEAACAADPSCRVFTFNMRSASCFPKAEPGAPVPFAGAMSVRLDRRPARALLLAETNLAALDLPKGDYDSALRQARALPYEHPLTGRPAETLLPSAQGAISARDFAEALRLTGEALTASDDPALWIDYAEAALGLADTDRQNARSHTVAARDAALNGYLRARPAFLRGRALQVLARAYEGLDRGRDAIPPLRLAQEIAPTPAVSAALDRAVGLWGFRVADTQVESDLASPRICAVFNEALQPGIDVTPFVGGLPAGAAVEARGRQLCMSGLDHGARYEMTIRAGLPAASGETLAAPIPIAQYVRDRAPLVLFPGRGYVLPAAAEPSLPVVTVNADALDLRLFRVSDRNLVRALQEDYFARPIEPWMVDRFESALAVPLWEGVAETGMALNEEVTTSLPLSGVLDGLEPGLYALRAAVPGRDVYDVSPATQWFVVSDLGIGTVEAEDGVHVMLRALSDAAPVEGAALELVSRANEVLGTATTDARGYARFEPGLAAGRDAMAPALVTARMGEDMAFLPLTGPAFDLSDRGVEGREPAGPVDVFLATDRGAYRPGETIHLTALARDGKVRAVDAPLVTILRRPDGVEHARRVTQGMAGGHVASFDLGPSAPRGTWRLAVHLDPDAPALATRPLLVEDFVPERIDVVPELSEAPIVPAAPPLLTVQVDYLFGAPGADLPVDGEVILRTSRRLAGWDGWTFGPHDAEFRSNAAQIEGVTTDAAGRAELVLPLPDLPGTGPWDAFVRVRASDGSNRPVERELVRSVAPGAALIGIRPLFDEAVPEGTEAAFEIVRLGGDLEPAPAPLRWTVSRVNTRYQWFRENGAWSWEPVVTRTQVASGEIAADGPMTVSVPVDWGRYEIAVTEASGPATASAAFDAGWYAVSSAFDTPDRLDVSLDRQGYSVGDTARFRIAAEGAGTALVSVLTGELVALEVVEVDGETVVELPVTEGWGSGAYVSATLLRPSGAPGRGPARALGIAHAAVDPGEAHLGVALGLPERTRPRGPLTVAIDAPGADWVTVAAVDVGVLNLTGFEAPDPAGHYFGQRALGVELRDIYGRLIEGGLGTPGRVRSGGDAAAGLSMDGTPPTEDVVALFSGPVPVTDGQAEVTFDLPPFDGTVRVMAVAWSEGGVGAASDDVIVRDPVVLSANLPRFLAPGDEARARLEIRPSDGFAGAVGLSVTAGDGLEILTPVPDSADLSGGPVTLPVTLAALEVGDPVITVAMTLPDGERLERDYRMPVRANDPEIARTSRLTLGPGQTLTLTSDVFDGFRPGASASLAVGEMGRLDAPGLLRMLERYPYGCSEQSASRAMPLLLMSSTAERLGIEARPQVEEGIARVLANQASNGSFGLWRPASGEFWLDAYLTDFLTRAHGAGFEVPEASLTLALDNLQNRINYAPDFERGGEDIAYALYVLAREGRAGMGDLRYYADVKGAALGTPLAQGQLAAALALYGDQRRADLLFAAADARMASLVEPKRPGWRDDYGTHLRDAAGLLALAAASGSGAVDRERLLARIASDGAPRSTQEAVWTLHAASALAASAPLVTIGGQPIEGSVRVLDEATAPGLAVVNEGEGAAIVTLTGFGVPEVPPAPGGEGYAIARRHFDMDGTPIDLEEVPVGTRIVTVIEVSPFDGREGRLMVTDPLPAGFEIDLPSVMVSGDAGALPWLTTEIRPETAEFRTDRFLAAVDWRGDAPFQLAYISRAVTPGRFAHPAPSVEDMYRPRFRATGEAGTVRVGG